MTAFCHTVPFAAARGKVPKQPWRAQSSFLSASATASASTSVSWTLSLYLQLQLQLQLRLDVIIISSKCNDLPQQQKSPSHRLMECLSGQGSCCMPLVAAYSLPACRVAGQLTCSLRYISRDSPKVGAACELYQCQILSRRLQQASFLWSSWLVSDRYEEGRSWSVTCIIYMYIHIYMV